MDRPTAIAAQRHAADLARAQWREARLDELAQIGMGLVRGLGSVDRREDTALKAVALRFSRLARALRVVLTLSAWFGEQILALMRGESLPEPWRRPRSPAATRPSQITPADPTAAAGPDAGPDSEPAETGEATEPLEPRAERDQEPRERIAYASWDEAIHAICNAFDIQDRSRFLEAAAPAWPPVDGAGEAFAEPQGRVTAPAGPAEPPWPLRASPPRPASLRPPPAGFPARALR